MSSAIKTCFFPTTLSTNIWETCSIIMFGNANATCRRCLRFCFCLGFSLICLMGRNYIYPMVHFLFEVKPNDPSIHSLGVPERGTWAKSGTLSGSVSEDNSCFTCGNDILPSTPRRQVVNLIPTSLRARFGAGFCLAIWTGSLQT